ncbi:60S ribosomal protein L11 [Linnemannia elongata]|nr:60S ribosomal protein L11 [Linnemannia elongata]
MDFFVCMNRPGNRITKRRRCVAKVGANHRVNKEETMNWFKQRYDGILTNKNMLYALFICAGYKVVTATV